MRVLLISIAMAAGVWICPAYAETDHCKDSLSLGTKQTEIRLDSSDFSQSDLILYERSEASSQSKSASGSATIPIYGTPVKFGASDQRAKSRAQAVRASSYSSMQHRTIVDSYLSKGDPTILGVWRDCMKGRGGLGAFLERVHGATFTLKLEWFPFSMNNGPNQTKVLNFTPVNAKVIGGGECLQADHVISAGGCTAILSIVDPAQAVTAVINTDLGTVSASVIPERRFRIKSMPYPASYQGKDIAPLSWTLIIKPIKKLNSGWTKPGTAAFQMDQLLVDEGWVFDVSTLQPVVRGEGYHGGCSSVADLVATDYIVTGSLKATTRRGDTGYQCGVTLVGEVMRVEEIT